MVGVACVPFHCLHFVLDPPPNLVVEKVCVHSVTMRLYCSVLRYYLPVWESDPSKHSAMSCQSLDNGTLALAPTSSFAL